MLTTMIDWLVLPLEHIPKETCWLCTRWGGKSFRRLRHRRRHTWSFAFRNRFIIFGKIVTFGFYCNAFIWNRNVKISLNCWRVVFSFIDNQNFSFCSLVNWLLCFSTSTTNLGSSRYLKREGVQNNLRFTINDGDVTVCFAKKYLN